MRFLCFVSLFFLCGCGNYRIVWITPEETKALEFVGKIEQIEPYSGINKIKQILGEPLLIVRKMPKETRNWHSQSFHENESKYLLYAIPGSKYSFYVLPEYIPDEKLSLTKDSYDNYRAKIFILGWQENRNTWRYMELESFEKKLRYGKLHDW